MNVNNLSCCSNTDIIRNVQDLAIESLKKFDINFDNNIEIQFLTFDVSIYHKENDEDSVFGEKLSLLYTMQFVTYNVQFLVKMLSFQYNIKNEILKLDIDAKTSSIKKEIEYCLNSLKRRRNLNLLFTSLKLFSRYVESRRLVCDIILRNNPSVTIEQNADGGIIVVYSDEKLKMRLGIFWSIECSATHEIKDIVEVYYNNFELPNKKDIERKLVNLTHPNLNFNEKYHLWKSLIDDISKESKQFQSALISCSPNVTNLTPIPITMFYNKSQSQDSVSSLNDVQNCQKVKDNESTSEPIEIVDASDADGVILLSDPEDNVSHSGQNVATLSKTPSKNFIRLDSEEEQFNLCRNQQSTEKKCKTNSSDSDLEITSVVYVIPD